MERLQTLVVGAGILGLAVARRLAQTGREVVVLERERAIGTGISSRNSEVIHAGLYYPSNSLKARCCIAGREQLYAYLLSRGLPHRKLGKLVVATTPAQRARLDVLARQAEANGCNEIALLSAREAQAMEPELTCHGALWSPETGILDSHQLMLSLQGDLEALGGCVALGTGLESARAVPGGFEVQCQEGTLLACKELVLATGLSGGDLCQRLEGITTEPPVTTFAKGNYYRYQGRLPFSHLIYPLPEPGGLGVHLTLDLQGQGRFGPNVEWVNSLDFTVTPGLEIDYGRSIRTFWPGVEVGKLAPDYAGVRPKLAQGGKFADFCLWDQAVHGVPGLLALLGVESPGLTSALALANEVPTRLGKPT